MIVVSTGPSGRVCNPAAWNALRQGIPALDAAQAGLTAAEADPTCDDIGYGGRPDAHGNMSLDAAIMDGRTHRAGSVAALTRCINPIAVARRVMEVTPYVFVVGQGARDFATAQGFGDDGPLLTPEAREAFEAFQRGERKPTFTGHSSNSHDTVGCCVLDDAGDLAVGCSTSGLDFKMPGRVGDSPIIGSGLYVENAVGAATCFGMGEQMMQVCLSFRIVAAMERGASPQEACDDGIRALIAKRPGVAGLSCCAVALSKSGETGGAATAADFVYYVSSREHGTVCIPAPLIS